MSVELMMATPIEPMESGHQITDMAHLNGSQKAAIVVQMILSEGGEMDLGKLAPDSQMRLAMDYASMVRVNRATLESVVDELETLLEDRGLEFPNQRDAVAENMDRLLSPKIATQFRNRLGVGPDSDPWRAAASMAPPEIAAILGAENPYVGGLILSKLTPEQAGETLELLPPEQATAMMLSIARSAAVAPAPVQRIGARIADIDSGKSPRAFDADPVRRSAAILNTASRDQREALLADFDDNDPVFAKRLRKAIFTFANIPARVDALDVPKFVREVPGEVMVQAMVAAQSEMQLVVDYILDNMSQRMATTLRDEMVDLGAIDVKPGEAAMGQITAIIRRMADDGTITLQVDEEDEA